MPVFCRAPIGCVTRCAHAMDLKVLDPVGSVAGEVRHRGAFVGLGNTHEEARELVVGRQ